MVIEFDSVGKTFRDGTAAVVDLSLTVPSDQITVIVGPSGCGKTTTLRMVNRMIEPNKGRITWDGTPLKSKRKTTLRRQMGYVIQSGGLFPHRTVLENIGTVPGLLGWAKPKTRKRSLELLDSVGLDRKQGDRFPAQLSGGQQQRVGVARALAADPLVMLMDEPFSAVDPVVRSELHEFFLNLQRELSKTIILITHDIEEAIKLGDQVAILRVGGKLAQVGTPQQLLNEPADSFVEGFVGRDRGYKSLSFSSAGSLAVERVKVVRDAASVRGPEPTLVVDGDARPLGWADGENGGNLLPLGSTFRPETDTLRAALDSALTSPYGLAVAVESGSGRYAGVVNARTILSQVSGARAAQPERIELAPPAPESTAGSKDQELTAVRPKRAVPVGAHDEQPQAGSGATVELGATPGPVEEAQTDETPVPHREPESRAEPGDPAPAASPSDPAPLGNPSEPAPLAPEPVEPAPSEPGPRPPAPQESGRSEPLPDTADAEPSTSEATTSTVVMGGVESDAGGPEPDAGGDTVPDSGSTEARAAGDPTSAR